MRRALKKYPIRMKDRLRRTGGFTLLELIVVMVIISLMAGIGLPFFARSLSRAEAKTAAGKIAAVMKLARSEAIATRQPVTAVVDAGKRAAYAVRGHFNIEEAATPVATPVEIPASVKIWTLGEKVVTVEFSPAGTSSSLTLSVTTAEGTRGNDENGYRITVDPLSGRTKVVSNSEFGKNEG